MPCFSVHYRICSHSLNTTIDEVKHDTYKAGFNHFQPKEICIPLVKPNQRTNSIKGTVGVLTWGHLSHWLLTASCSDIWPRNLAWQKSSTTLRPVRQTHTCSWKQPDALTITFTKSHIFLFFKQLFCVCRCLQLYMEALQQSFLWFYCQYATAWGYAIILHIEIERLLT